MRKMTQFSDAELIENYQKGNKKAIVFLVERWHKTFCKVAFVYVKNPDEAKDIAQESWTIILSKIDDLQDASKFKFWGISIVKRKAIDYLRSKKREKIHQEKLKNETFEDVDVEDISEVKKQLKEAVIKLPFHQQTVLKLFYIEEYSLKEIATTLEVSVGTVKSRLYNAREKLKSILKYKL